MEATASPLLQLVTQADDAELASAWLDGGLTMAGIEGIVAKRDEPYPRPNVRRWLKLRRIATIDVEVCGFIGDPESPRLVVALRNGRESRPAGTTLPLGPNDAARIGVVAPLAVAADRQLWAPFDSGRVYRWFRIPPGLVAEVAFSHLDGDYFRHTVRFVRWRQEAPGRR